MNRIKVLASHLLSPNHNNGSILRSTSTSSKVKPKPPTKSDYKYFQSIGTRWKDNDIYGHINNVTYYSFFDTIVNSFLIHKGGLDIHDKSDKAVVGVVVETFCQFHKPIAFPDSISAGLRVVHVGSSSVKYEIGIFKEQDEDASANGHFVHVFVNRNSMKPVAIPPTIKTALESILVNVK